ncbi:MAG: PEP/pyruvate-binding domain-containing protein [Dissulfurispiraceae bacterium]
MNRFLSIFSKSGRCPSLKATQGAAAKKYAYFKNLLGHNHAALDAIAELEKLYYSGDPFSLTSVRIKYEELLEAVRGVIYALETLSGRDYSVLSNTVSIIDSELFQNFNPKCTLPTGNLVIGLEDLTSDIYRMVGAKAANLASIKNRLGLSVPPGFIITSLAFERFLQVNRLLKPIKEELSRVTSESIEAIERTGDRLRSMILNAPVPLEIQKAVIMAYSSLEETAGMDVRIAMRSSAVGEDTEATFAGQYDTVLNVTGENILDAYKTVLASKYSARAIAYRLRYGLDDRETPMCVLGIVMVNSQASGVLYSVDPSLTRSCPVKINSLWGIGEHLVDGSASPDVFLIDRIDEKILERHVAVKESRLVNLNAGGTGLESVPEHEQHLPSLDDVTIVQLAKYGLLLEEFFEGPQDVEWAIDADRTIFILQSRPLRLPEINVESQLRQVSSNNPVLISQGKTASGGTATGRVFIMEQEPDLRNLPADAILVAKIASPEYAKVIGSLRGIVTDIGSVTSHMASVAREFGIPTIVDTGNATSSLTQGEIVTMSADTVTVYKGIVPELIDNIKPAKKVIFDSPLHRRMRGILDRVSVLNLTDIKTESFSPEGCRTYHDIVRFTHETAIHEMFGISCTSNRMGASVKLTSNLPLDLWLIDLGEGLREGLTICDKVTPEMIESDPMKAVWRGFTHPGVNWAGTMNVSTNKVTGMLAAPALAEFGEIAGGESYAMLSKGYLNLSVRFAYHFATVDTFCSDNESQNYISMQFSGGAGDYYGRSLRIQLMGNILERIGFRVTIKGDLLEAFVARYDKRSTEEMLDMTARLLASTRLIDITLSTQDELAEFTDAFFNGSYDFLAGKTVGAMPNFYLRSGHWTISVEDGRTCCLQDGSRWGRRIVPGISGFIGKVVGGTYHEFLDTIEAYHYFPMAILRNLELSEETISVNIKPIGGNIDRAGGIAFGIKDIDNYFVLRTNALEGNIILFEYINGRRIEKCAVRKKIETGKWHSLLVEISGHNIKGSLNGELLIAHNAGRSLKGYIGLWTKADSVTCFNELIIESNGSREDIKF